MLAIHEDLEVMKPYYTNTTNRKEQKEILHQWMTEELGMTASFPETFLSPISENKSHPSKLLYNDIKNTSDQDFLYSLKKLQFDLLDTPIFTSFSGVKDCLKTSQCYTVIQVFLLNIFYQLSQICHNIQ